MTSAAKLPAANVVLDLRVGDKAALLRELGHIAERCGAGVAASVVTEALARREALGSTGLGGGFALPHASLPGLASYFVAVVRLARPIPFDAVDDAPVDIACMLLTPASGTEHVATLATYSRLFRGTDQLMRVRSARTADELVRSLGHGGGSPMRT